MRQAGALAPTGLVGILADDLTGACDTALQFLAPGENVFVVPEMGDRPRLPSAATVLAINTESRHLAPKDAAAKVDRAARILWAYGCRRFYKKMDSTLRGPWDQEARQALRAWGHDLAVVAPAFPQAGRLTVGGYQLVDGVPVSVSPYAHDPMFPVKHSHLPTLLGAAGENDWAWLPLQTVMEGAEAIAVAIGRARQANKRILIVDAAREADLQAIARAIRLTPYALLPVGSAGLALALTPGRLAERGEILLGAREPVLVVSGSLNPVTLRQLEAIEKTTRVLKVDVPGLLLGQEDAATQLVKTAQTLLSAKRDLVITLATDEEAGRKGLQLGREVGLGAKQTGEQLVKALGAIVGRVVADVSLAGLILAGGETAYGVCRALGGAPLKLLAEISPAMPLCRLETRWGPLRVITKSGGFGGPEAMGGLVEKLGRSPIN